MEDDWQILITNKRAIRSRCQVLVSRLAGQVKPRMAKIPKTHKDTVPYDAPAYAAFSGHDVASISKFIQTGLLQMLR